LMNEIIGRLISSASQSLDRKRPGLPSPGALA
jgi:hypothetical protein